METQSKSKIRKAERLDILVFERFEPDLEFLIIEENIPLFTINITRDLTQLLAKSDTRRIPANGTAILIELMQSSMLRKCMGINGRQSGFGEQNIEQAIESETI